MIKFLVPVSFRPMRRSERRSRTRAGATGVPNRPRARCVARCVVRCRSGRPQGGRFAGMGAGIRQDLSGCPSFVRSAQRNQRAGARHPIHCFVVCSVYIGFFTGLQVFSTYFLRQRFPRSGGRRAEAGENRKRRPSVSCRQTKRAAPDLFRRPATTRTAPAHNISTTPLRRRQPRR